MISEVQRADAAMSQCNNVTRVPLATAETARTTLHRTKVCRNVLISDKIQSNQIRSQRAHDQRGLWWMGWTVGPQAPRHQSTLPVVRKHPRWLIANQGGHVLLFLQPYANLASLLNVLSVSVSVSVRNRAEGDPIRRPRPACASSLPFHYSGLGYAYRTGNLQTLSHSAANKNLTEQGNTGVNYRLVHRHYVRALKSSSVIAPTPVLLPSPVMSSCHKSVLICIDSAPA